MALRLDELPDALTVEQTAKVLGLGRNTAYEAIKTGDLPSVRIGGRIIVPKARLQKLLDGEGLVSERSLSGEQGGQCNGK